MKPAKRESGDMDDKEKGIKALGEEFFEEARLTEPGESIIETMKARRNPQRRRRDDQIEAEAMEMERVRQHIAALSYALTQRLRFIDFVVDHYGYINRSTISDYFGMSTVQASLDIHEYKALAPANLEYTVNGKTYEKSKAFKRVWQ